MNAPLKWHLYLENWKTLRQTKVKNAQILDLRSALQTQLQKTSEVEHENTLLRRKLEEVEQDLTQARMKIQDIEQSSYHHVRSSKSFVISFNIRAYRTIRLILTTGDSATKTPILALGAQVLAWQKPRHLKSAKLQIRTCITFHRVVSPPNNIYSWSEHSLSRRNAKFVELIWQVLLR